MTVQPARTSRVTRIEVEAAWSAYQPLAAACASNPSLVADRDHCERMARAWAAWRDLFIEWDCTDAE